MRSEYRKYMYIARNSTSCVMSQEPEKLQIIVFLKQFPEFFTIFTNLDKQLSAISYTIVCLMSPNQKKLLFTTHPI